MKQQNRFIKPSCLKPDQKSNCTVNDVLLLAELTIVLRIRASLAVLHVVKEQRSCFMPSRHRGVTLPIRDPGARKGWIARQLWPLYPRE